MESAEFESAFFLGAGEVPSQLGDDPKISVSQVWWGRKDLNLQCPKGREGYGLVGRPFAPTTPSLVPRVGIEPTESLGFEPSAFTEIDQRGNVVDGE